MRSGGSTPRSCGSPSSSGRAATSSSGEGYWIRPPLQPELDALGAAEDELPDLPGLLAAGESLRLRPVYLATATDEDWRRYEWAYVLNLETFASAQPDEPGSTSCGSVPTQCASAGSSPRGTARRSDSRSSAGSASDHHVLWASTPPSTTRFAPEIQRAAGERRNSTASATSVGVPNL